MLVLGGGSSHGGGRGGRGCGWRSWWWRLLLLLLLLRSACCEFGLAGGLPWTHSVWRHDSRSRRAGHTAKPPMSW